MSYPSLLSLEMTIYLRTEIAFRLPTKLKCIDFIATDRPKSHLEANIFIRSTDPQAGVWRYF